MSDWEKEIAELKADSAALCTDIKYIREDINFKIPQQLKVVS